MRRPWPTGAVVPKVKLNELKHIFHKKELNSYLDTLECRPVLSVHRFIARDTLCLSMASQLSASLLLHFTTSIPISVTPYLYIVIHILKYSAALPFKTVLEVRDFNKMVNYRV